MSLVPQGICKQRLLFQGCLPLALSPPHSLCPDLQQGWDLGLFSIRCQSLTLFITVALNSSPQVPCWIYVVAVLLGLCQQSILGVVFHEWGALGD